MAFGGEKSSRSAETTFLHNHLPGFIHETRLQPTWEAVIPFPKAVSTCRLASVRPTDLSTSAAANPRRPKANSVEGARSPYSPLGHTLHFQYLFNGTSSACSCEIQTGEMRKKKSWKFLCASSLLAQVKR